MDYKYIEQLLERYFQAETTLKEEQILKTFFAQGYDELPAGLRKYKSLFAAFDNDDRLPDDFDERIMKLTEGNVVVKARTISMAARMKPLFRAAAVVAILLTLSNALNQSFKADNVWTDEEQVADYRAAIHDRALAVASEDSLVLLTEGITGRRDSLAVDSLYNPTGYIE